jgi:hypothetical protein
MGENAPYQEGRVENLAELSEHLQTQPEITAGTQKTNEDMAKVSVEAVQSDIEAAFENTNDAAPDPVTAVEQANSEPITAAVPPSKLEKQYAAKRQLKAIQKQLPATEVPLSHLIHQKTVKAVSEAAAKTVSRPSGLLGGGIMAFIGSAGYLVFSKHIGAPYNSGMFILLFVVGFMVGLGLELILRSFHKRSV